MSSSTPDSAPPWSSARCSATGSPRAYAANSASARNLSAVPTLAPARSIGPIAARTPSTPTVPSRRDARNAGHRDGSQPPDVRSTSRRTALAAFTTRVAPVASTRSTRCRSSPTVRHPKRPQNARSPEPAGRDSTDATTSTTTASTRRCASPAIRSSSIFDASLKPTTASERSTASRSATTWMSASTGVFIPEVNSGPPTFIPG